MASLQVSNCRNSWWVYSCPKIEEGEAKAHTQLRASFHQGGGGTMDRGRGRPTDAALAAGHSIPLLRYRRRRRATNGEEDREGVTSGESLGRSLFLQKYGTNFFTPRSSLRFPPLLARLRRPRWEKLEKVGVGVGRELKGPLCSTKSSVYVHDDALGRFQFCFEGGYAALPHL